MGPYPPDTATNWPAYSRRVYLAPSILSADLAFLGEQVRAVEEAGADRLHVAAMDAPFVLNLTFGPPVVQALRPVTRLPIYAHLMVEEPERLLRPFAAAGANGLIVHVEACPHLHRLIGQIHELGCRAGVALNPATPLVALEEILTELDQVLVMSVNPGWGGQPFIVATLRKIARLKRMLLERGLEQVEIAVDGGIDRDTAPSVVWAGADVLVAGASVFKAEDGPAAAVHRLRQTIAEALEKAQEVSDETP